jgi:hypothetical protein
VCYFIPIVNHFAIYFRLARCFKQVRTVCAVMENQHVTRPSSHVLVVLMCAQHLKCHRHAI